MIKRLFSIDQLENLLGFIYRPITARYLLVDSGYLVGSFLWMHDKSTVVIVNRVRQLKSSRAPSPTWQGAAYRVRTWGKGKVPDARWMNDATVSYYGSGDSKSERTVWVALEICLYKTFAAIPESIVWKILFLCCKKSVVFNYFAEKDVVQEKFRRILFLIISANSLPLSQLKSPRQSIEHYFTFSTIRRFSSTAAILFVRLKALHFER